jgi:hypothetical protein
MINKRFLALLSSALTALPTLWAQAPPSNPQAEVVVRMERVRRDEKVCVEVDGAGAYQLEKVYPAKSEVYDGTLAAASLSELQRSLNQDELRRLSQQQITSPPASENLEQVTIAIRREDGWQKLSFTTPESRKPFASFVGPLTQWLDTVAKERPGASLVKREPTHCGSAGERTVATALRGGVSSSSHVKAATSSGAIAPFVMRISVEHVANGRAFRTCATVYPDLHYHLERSEQNPAFQVKPKVYESSVTAEQLDELRRLLDAPELKTLEHTNLPNGVAVREADFTVMSIARPGGIQNLAFSSYFGIQNDRRDTTRNASNSRYSTDEEVRVVKPVQKWLKDAIESRKAPEIKNAVATDCVP